MIKFERPFYWQWKPGFCRIGMGFRIYLPALTIQVGHSTPPCRVCGEREKIITWREDNPGATICPDCCEHPDYEYERGDRDYFCVECGNSAPYDWIDGLQGDDDCCGVSFYSEREPGEPIGTPISELSGRTGHPGFERFKAIAQSWGYD